MGQGQQRDGRKERQWQRRIQQWRQSGLSVRAFCQRHGLSEPSFYSWRRELQRRRAAAPVFVPVQVVDDSTPPTLPKAAGSGAGFEIVLADQRVVRVAADFDPAALRRLLAVLEEKPC